MSSANCSNLKRRELIRLAVASSVLLASPRKGHTKQTVGSELDALGSRLDGSAAPRMQLKQDRASLRSDIIYPDFFLGKWQVDSTLLSVRAPAGPTLFGSEGSLERVQELIGGPPLSYKVRFIRDSRGQCVADREYNIVQIASAALGQGSVLSVNTNNGDINFSEIELRAVGGQLFSVRMETSSRQSGWDREATELLAAETVSQVVRLRSETGAGLQDKFQRKEIETICSYHVAKDQSVMDSFGMFQKTLTFLPISDLRSSLSKGLAIDERTYNVTYSRLL